MQQSRSSLSAQNIMHRNEGKCKISISILANFSFRLFKSRQQGQKVRRALQEVNQTSTSEFQNVTPARKLEKGKRERRPLHRTARSLTCIVCLFTIAVAGGTDAADPSARRRTATLRFYTEEAI